MVNKKNLKSSRQYSNVYIEHDQPKSERLIASNFRAILTAIRRRDTYIRMHGAKVIVQNSVNNTRTFGNTEENGNRDFSNRIDSQFKSQASNVENRNNGNHNSIRNSGRGRGRGGSRG